MNIQENIERIKSVMGIYEQQSQGRCDQWKNGTFVNGDGIKTPKITITKTPTLIEGLYEGPDKGFCIQRSKYYSNDTPHQLASITVFYEAAPYLKELYKNGTYVKPDMNNITMDREINKMFKISIPLISTTEDKAITSINERGGMGHGGDLTEITNIENDPNNKLIEKVKKTAGDMTETFICFRNILNFPIKTVTPESTPEPVTNEPTPEDLENLKLFKDFIKNWWVDEDGNSQLNGDEEYMLAPKLHTLFIVKDNTGTNYIYKISDKNDTNIITFTYLGQRK